MSKQEIRLFIRTNNYSPGCATDENINTATHLLGFLFSILGTAILVVYSVLPTEAPNATPWSTVSLAIYGGSLLFLFLASTLHHGIGLGWGLSIRWYGALRLMDHIAISVLIWGTFTPICLIVLRDLPMGWIVWGYEAFLMILNITLKSIFRWDMPGYVENMFYLSMGWTAVFVFGVLKERLGAAFTNLLLGGGIFYTIGVVFFAMSKPIVPHKFSGHEVFHFMILAAAACHWYGIFKYVLPY
jgi:hemolysin III